MWPWPYVEVAILGDDQTTYSWSHGEEVLLTKVKDAWHLVLVGKLDGIVHVTFCTTIT